MLEEVLDDNAKIVEDEIHDEGRWSLHHRLVFRHDGKVYEAYYSVGATEIQEERPWDDEDVIECTEVMAVEKTVIEWVVTK